MTDQYIDVIFDGPPGPVSGRFVEVENEAGQSISTGEWIDPTKQPGFNKFEDVPYWRLRIKVKPGLNALASIIHDRADASGFWPKDRDNALEALARLDADAGGAELLRRDISIVRQYVAAQAVRNMGEMLMLAVTELAEGLEEDRDGKPVHYYTALQDGERRQVTTGSSQGYEFPNGARVPEGTLLKPEGLAVELADCIIRCLDTMQSLDVDIEGIVREKMDYNAQRAFKHGKAY